TVIRSSIQKPVAGLGILQPLLGDRRVGRDLVGASGIDGQAAEQATGDGHQGSLVLLLHPVPSTTDSFAAASMRPRASRCSGALLLAADAIGERPGDAQRAIAQRQRQRGQRTRRWSADNPRSLAEIIAGLMAWALQHLRRLQPVGHPALLVRAES